MVKNWSSQFKNALATQYGGDNESDIRAYLDPRMVDFPLIAGTEVYYTNTSDDPVMGEYSLDQSTGYTAFPFSYPITFEALVHPNFAYNVANDQEFCKFYSDVYDSARIALCYFADTDQLGVKIYQNLAGAGGGAITSVTAKLAKVYTADAQLQQWIRLTCVLTSTGVSIYANGNGYVTAAVTMANIRDFELFSPGNNVDIYVNYALIIPGLTATAAQIINHYKGVGEEQVFFDFQQRFIGQTRCDITSYLRSYSLQYTDGYAAANGSMRLESISGEFADDQYAAFSPGDGNYNGTSAEKYLTKSMRCQLVQRSRQKPEINNAGSRVGYWSMDQALTEYPDAALGAAPDYLSNFATTDSWTGSGATISVSGGVLRATSDGSSNCFAVRSVGAPPNAKTWKCMIRGSKAMTITMRYHTPSYVIAGTISATTSWQPFTGYCPSGADNNNIYLLSVGLNAGDYYEISWFYVGDGAYATLLIDNSGMGGPGTIVGGTPVDGKHGKCLYFDGLNDHVITQNIRHAITLTYGAWVYITEWPGAGELHTILSRTGVGWRYGVYESGGVYYILHNWLDAAGALQSNSYNITGAITLNAWYHVAVTHDGTYSRIYLNGTLVDTGAASSMQAEGSQSTAAYWIGAYTAGVNNFAGCIDEVIIDAVAWTAEEVKAYYDKTMSESYALTTDPRHDQIIAGYIDPGSFARSTRYDSTAQYNVQFDDFIKIAARRRVRSSRVWDSYYLARATPSSDSLWHELAWLAAKKEVYNYLGNSGFENATPGNSWLVSGTGAAIALSGGVKLNGTYSGKFEGTSGTLTLYQTSVFEVSKGDTLTFQIYAYRTAGAGNISLTIQEYAGAVAGSSTSEITAHGNRGWELCKVKHTIADTSSDRVRVTLSTTMTRLYVDMAMLTFGETKYFYIDNTADGSSGVFDGDNAVQGTYLQIGCVTEDVDYVHPWGRIDKGSSAWDRLKDCSDACLARYMHVTQAGVLKMQSYFETADETTSRGTLPVANSLEKLTQPIVANKIDVRGVYIDERDYYQMVWNAKSASVENESSIGDKFEVVLTDTETYPSTTNFPDGLECLYEDGERV